MNYFMHIIQKLNGAMEQTGIKPSVFIHTGKHFSEIYDCTLRIPTAEENTIHK